ncbi:MAG: hypothetical protein JWN70_5469 [Planctomycetaceae bacterium]|nr:hypothetical protein [Planctomycetaceae bacterium]
MTSCWRFGLALLVFGNVSLSCIGTSDALAAERQVFLYQDGGGALVHDYSNRWVEIVGSSERFAFEEISRTADMIELQDRTRDLGLQVGATRGEIRLPRSKVWQPWQAGKWIEIEELPKSMMFVPTDQKIRLIYFVPVDRQPITSYEQRIKVVMQVVADQYRSELKVKGYDSDGFQLELDEKQEPIIHLVKSKSTAQYYNGAPTYDLIQHYQRVQSDIPPDVGTPRRHMFVIFAETYDPGPAPIEWNGSIGRGGHLSADGGLAIMSAWILREELCANTYAAQKKLMQDKTPIAGRAAFGSNQPNAPRYKLIEDGFGAVVHELGHALGLPHDYRQPHDFMGHGFRSLHLNYLTASTMQRVTFSRENARLLGVSRYLMPNLDLTDNTLPAAEVKLELVKRKQSTLSISMTAKDDRGLRAVVFHDVQRDSVIGGAELTGREQIVDLKLPLDNQKPGKFTLNTLVADDAGNIATITTILAVP